MKKIFFSILVLLLKAPVIVWAEQNHRMDTVFVTASRTGASEIDTNFQTGSVSVIQVSDAGKTMATVADLLDHETSVQVRQLAGLGSYSAVSIRGSSANQVNVFLDGVLLNDAYGGSVDLSQFLLNHIEKIEIYRGGVPVQLGAAGIGGAINIITKQSDGQSSGQYELGYGSYESKKVAGSWAGNFHEHQYQAAVSYLGSDNDFDFLNTANTPDVPSDDFIEPRRNAQFDQFSGMFSLRSRLDQERSLKTVLQHEKKDKHTPNALNDSLNNATYDSAFTSLKFDLDTAIDTSSSIGYQLSLSHKVSEFKDLEGKVGIAENDERTILDSFSAQIDYARTFKTHVVNVHAEYDFQDYRVRDPLERVHQEVERQRVRLALQDEWVNRDGDLLFTARAAYEFHQDSDQLRKVYGRH